MARVRIKQQRQRLPGEPVVRRFPAERQRQLGIRQRDPIARAGAVDRVSAFVAHQSGYAARWDYSEHHCFRGESMSVKCVLEMRDLALQRDHVAW